MKVALVHNIPERAEVLTRRRREANEAYRPETIEWLLDALQEADFEAVAFEGDTNLVDRLAKFINPERNPGWPGLVLNLTYGVQGRAPYVHVPALLEMAGVPYVGSGPLAHALCSDKITSKMVWRHHGLPTPDFEILRAADAPLPNLEFPLVVKPRAEATSRGLALVENEEELREAVDEDLRRFRQPVLVESYVEGRELNVNLLGNGEPTALPPAEIRVGGREPTLFTKEDKEQEDGRKVDIRCPASLPKEIEERAARVAIRAFRSLECQDWARADFRLDREGELHLLEMNSLPHLNPGSSFVAGARGWGLEISHLLRRLLGIAADRWREEMG